MTPGPRLRLMETKELAALCIAASGFPTATAVEADRGRELYEKWKTTEDTATAHGREGLRRAMVYFLASVLPRHNIVSADVGK